MQKIEFPSDDESPSGEDEEDGTDFWDMLDVLDVVEQGQKTAAGISLDKNVTALEASNVATKSKSSNRLKGAVSKKKRRFIQDGFDLDLTYVTDRIIAMGFPSEGIEGVYRNKMADVQKFFKVRHDGHFMIYNLCSERDYDHAKFDNRVVNFPFDDHNCPFFEELHPFCERMDEFLCKSDKNVVAMHCKAGKGRTGLLICVYLLHTGMWTSTEEALSYYGVARTKNMKGVTIPSQRRWVRYYERYVKLRDSGELMPSPVPKRIKRIRVSSTCPEFKMFQLENQSTMYKSKEMKGVKVKREADGSYNINLERAEISVLKDVKCTFYNKGTFGGKKRAFSLWFHTQFIEDNALHLDRHEIDKVNKDKKCKDFTLDIEFEPTIDEAAEEDEEDIDWDESTVEAICAELRENVKVKKRSWRLKTYDSCFPGREAVTFMLKNVQGCRTRKNAVKAGNLMIKAGLMKEVKRQDEECYNRFVNGPNFYVFT